MKSLSQFINEAAVKDIKSGSEIYFRFHNDGQIYKLTVDRTEPSGLYLCCYLKENAAKLSCLGIREKHKQNELYLVWTADEKDDPSHGIAAFEEEPLRKEVSEKLQKSIDEIMQKISKYEAQIVSLQAQVNELNAEKESLEKKINAEVK